MAESGWRGAFLAGPIRVYMWGMAKGKEARCQAMTCGGKRCQSPSIRDGACGIEAHRHQVLPASEPVTSADLSPRQVQAAVALASRQIGETLADVAERAGVTPRTLYRYLQSEDFIVEFRKRVEDELGSERAKVAGALVRGACWPGAGQAAMQKIYWQRLGELIEKGEISGPGGNPIIARIERVIVDPSEDTEGA